MIAENGGDAGKLTPRFIERVTASLAAKGLRTGGWSDGMGHTETANMPKAPHLVQTNIWGVLHSGAIREAHDQLNRGWDVRSEEHTSELQSLMRISYAVFCLK